MASCAVMTAAAVQPSLWCASAARRLAHVARCAELLARVGLTRLLILSLFPSLSLVRCEGLCADGRRRLGQETGPSDAHSAAQTEGVRARMGTAWRALSESVRGVR